jgi:putative ABC transport system permease protein
MTTLLRHVRFSARLLLRNPLFALVAVGTLGLGIAATTAIFSAVDAVVLHPLHFKNPDQLVIVTKNMPMFELAKSDSSALDFLDYRRLGQSFSQMATFDINSVNLTGDQDPLRVFGLHATASLFPMLGVQPVLGRFFTADEEQPGHNHVVVLGTDLWKTRFGADPQITGKQVQLDGESYTVIGVVEPVLQFLETSQLYVPLAFGPADLVPDARGHQRYEVLARLRPGVTMLRARAEMKVVAAQMTHNLPDWYPKGWSIDVDPLAQAVAGEMGTPLKVLLAAVGIVLLIACANVANLLLARATSRQKEIGIRTALGAERGQILLQLLTESLLMSVLAGALGLTLADWMLDLFVRFGPPDFFHGQELQINGLVAAFTLGLSLLTSVIFGLAPAISTSKVDLNDALKAGSGRLGAGQHGGWLRSFLVVAEVALSIVLLAGAGLLLRSFERLASANPGFQTDHLLTARISLPVVQYSHDSDIQAFYSQLRAGIAALPGVVSIDLIDGLPFGAGGGGGTFSIIGHPWSASEPVPDVERRMASPSYFQTMRIPLKQGRTFTDQDAGSAPKVAVVDETFARTFFPEGDAIGQQITFRTRDEGAYQIVGIVGAVKDRSLVTEPRPMRYFSSLQVPAPFMNIVVRTTLDPLQVISGIQARVRELDRNLPVYRIATMEQLLANSLAQRRLVMLLLALLAGFALLLSAVGIYGVVSYAVSQRTAEIGIRMALGAETAEVQRMLLRQALSPVIAGVAIGLPAAAAATQLLASLLYQVTATDPLTFLAAPTILFMVAAAAIHIPARRATRIDPMMALRYD